MCAKSPGGDRPLFQGTAADVIADIRAYAAAGVTHFVFDPTVPDLKAALTNMERFAQDIRGKLGHAVERSHTASKTGHPRRKATSRPSLQS